MKNHQNRPHTSDSVMKVEFVVYLAPTDGEGDWTQKSENS